MSPNNPHPPAPSPAPSLPPSPGEGEKRLLSGPLPWVIAWRFLRGRRSRLLDGTARAALLSTALGVTAMVIAMALMTGYREDLQSKLVRGNAAVIAYPVGGETGALPDAKRQALLAIPGVEQIGRVAYGQGSLSSSGRPQGIEVILRNEQGEACGTPHNGNVGLTVDGVPVLAPVTGKANWGLAC